MHSESSRRRTLLRAEGWMMPTQVWALLFLMDGSGPWTAAVAFPGVSLIPALNVIGGRNGVGRIDMFEDGIMDLKSREIYEAPAAHILLKLHRDLEQWCLMKDEIQFKKIVDAKWAYMTYHGEWYHPLKAALDSFIAETQRAVNGRYTVKLYKGNIDILERESSTGLFSPEILRLA